MNEEIIHKEELLERVRKGWDEFQAYIKTLTDEQLTGPKDAAGWTAKDHLMHLAVWEDGIYALLEKQNRREAMGLDEATWASKDFDRMNAVIEQQHKDKSLAEVQRAFREIHERLVAKVESLTDEELQLPYMHYDPTDTRDKPVTIWIRGDTYEHYAQHQPWIAAIVGKD
jgi:uncharacterized protein (TIGR03083 family)